VEWLNVTAEQGLGGLFLASFLASTVLPGGSEALLWAFLRQHPEQAAAALALATAGNTGGGMFTWWCGRFLPKWQKLEDLPQRARVARWGSPVLLLSWTPLVGDALCLAAGWLRLHWLPCCLFMAAGKFARYWVVAQAAL
jgi:membrane protein YqaA with SNARE-associated domain